MIITQSKFSGFALNEIKHLIYTWENVAIPTSEKLKVIELKLEGINGKMRQLEEVKSYLLAKCNRVTQTTSS